MIAGQTNTGGLFDAFVQKFDLNGNPQWARQFGTTGDDFVYGIALGPQYVYAAGQADSGVFLWRFTFSGEDTGNLRRGTFATFGYGVTLDGTLVSSAGVDPRVARAVRPGEIVQFYATGFGRTNPPAPSDRLFPGAPEVVTRPRITIGGREAAIGGNGNLVSPGLYQFNLTIPDLADGDHAIVAEIGATRSSATVFLAVRR